MLAYTRSKDLELCGGGGKGALRAVVAYNGEGSPCLHPFSRTAVTQAGGGGGGVGARRN